VCLLRGTGRLFIYNSTFCPHSVFMCFVWISEQTAIVSLYSTNWLVFITETECVYCAVRTESLFIMYLLLVFKKLRRPVVGLTTDGRVRSQVSVCPICGGQMGTCTGVSPSTSVSPSVSFHPPMLNVHLHLHGTLTRRTKRRSLETCKKAMLSRKSGSTRYKTATFSL
jgi:hypothetical protein